MARPVDFTPAIGATDAVGAPTDPPEERIDVGVVIVGAGPGGLACAIRLGQLLEEHPGVRERLGEVPIAVLILVRMGAVTIEQLSNIRPYFIVGSFVVAAIVTPPDVLSQLLLAIPLCVLYEVGILAARVFGKAARSGDDERETRVEG